MVLVDTSVWIAHFRGLESPETLHLARLIDDEEDLCVCGLILTEVLQGIRSDTQFNRIERSFAGLIYLPTTRNAYLTAASLYRKARRSGITIRRSLDCVIAGCAIDNRVPVLHRDRDFERIARFSRLTIA